MNFEVYPASFVDKRLENEELVRMKWFLDDSRKLFDKHNIGIKEHFFWKKVAKTFADIKKSSTFASQSKNKGLQNKYGDCSSVG